MSLKVSISVPSLHPSRLILCSLLLLCSCGTVRPGPDYQNAAQVIARHTGSNEVYDPELDQEIDAKVRKLLAEGLSIERAVQIALLNNRAFQSLFLEIGIGRADVVQSSLLSNPTLSLLPRFPDIGGRINLQAGFAQEIADIWRIPLRKRVAEANLRHTVLKVADTATNLAAQVKTFYYRLAMLQQGDVITEENIAALERSMTLTQHRFDVGETTILDVYLVKSDLFAARMRRFTIQRDLNEARASLAKILGLSESDPRLALTDGLLQPKTELVDDDALINIALAQRLDAQMSSLEVKAAEKELVRQYRSVIPSLSIGVEMERTDRKAPPSRFKRGMAAWNPAKDSQPSFPTPREDKLAENQIVDYLVGPSFQITLPIWDQNRAQIAKARLLVQQKRKDHEDRVQSICEDVKKASAAVRSTESLLESYVADALPQAEKNVDTARRVYEAGEDSVLVLVAAQKTLIDLRDTYNQTLGEYALSMVQLERAVGGRLNAPAGNGSDYHAKDVQ